MKRILLFPLLIAFFCSCEKTDDSIESDSMKQIRFDVETLDTKSSIITGDKGNNPLLSMNVFCAYGTTEKYQSSDLFNFMYKAKVTRNNASAPWTIHSPAPDKWQGPGYYSFFAFAPDLTDNDDFTYSLQTVAGPPSVSYTVPQSPTLQSDLLYSSQSTINGALMYVGAHPVRFTFSHAMSKIIFRAALTSDYAAQGNTVQIRKIEINNLINSGSLTIGMNDTYTQIKDATWTIGSNRSTFEASVANNGLIETNLTDQSQVISKEEGVLLLMPQPLTDQVDLTVYYTETAYGETTPLEKMVIFGLKNFTAEWTKGKGYIYDIIYDGKATVPWAITATLSPWNDENVQFVIPATYLHTDKSVYTTTADKSLKIYYTTNGSDVSASCTQGVALTHETAPSAFVVPASTPVGSYIVTLRSGLISRKITVIVN